MKKISWDSMAETLSDEERNYRRRLQEARSEAITYLGLAKKPSGKVSERLQREGFEDSVIQEVLKELKAEGYLDDALIARRIARQRQGRQSESKFALRYRMLSSGLEPAVVDAVLTETDSDKSRAKDLIHSRFQLEFEAMHSEDTKKSEKQKLFLKMARFLARRGFEQSVIEQVLRRD